MRTATRGLVVFAGLLSVPNTPNMPLAAMQVPQTEEDPRTVQLKRFLEEYDSPMTDLAADFIEAADRHELDWRLLPSIAIMESSGGRYYVNNNVFGWDNCRTRFRSVREGIHVVARELAKSDTYRNKDLDTLLRTYNPERDDYGRKVKGIMRRMGSATPEGGASQVN